MGVINIIITDFTANGYKNLKEISINLDPRMNIFCGENAQGKTNLIEAMWLCSGCKSFRGTRDKDFIGFDEEKADIKLNFKNKIRKQEISFIVAKENIKDKRVTLNGVKLSVLSKLFGNLKCVIFTPEDLELSKGSPENRRSFLDLCISQIKPSYVSAINKYDLLISQRNALLKEIAMGRTDQENLNIWDEQIALTGSYISILRNTYTKKLDIFTDKMYFDLTKQREKLSLHYNSTIFDELDNRLDYKGEMAKEYLKKLKNNVKDDIKLGFTQIGTHRDDVITKINGLNSRDFGSQGQQRSIALIMKLSQAQILFDETGEAPVILLDDVLSELDLSRQDFVLNEINNMQLFVTCCDATAVLKHKMGSVFYMDKGKIISQN